MLRADHPRSEPLELSIGIVWQPDRARQTIVSCLRQRGVALEILLLLLPGIDGADEFASADPRIRRIPAEANHGDDQVLRRLAEQARGAWCALVRPGDLLHPDRSLRLIAAAETCGADLVADDQLLFDDANPRRSRLLLGKRDARRARRIEESDLHPRGRRTRLDRLSPMFRVAPLRALPESVKDCEAVPRLLREGRTFHLVPEPLTFRAAPSGSARQAQADRGAVPFISRQRLIGATNGSSAYLLAIAAAVRDAGFSPRLIQPSPTIFGRMPFYRLHPGMRLFDAIHVRGAVRLGDWLVAVTPGPYVGAIRAKLSLALRRIGARGAWLQDHKAPYAVTTPWTRDDRLFVARHAPPAPAAVIADYAFQAEGLPYLLAPEAPSAIVMHDLFHERATQFEPGADSVAVIDKDAEITLLAKADAVIAIQPAEARFVQEKVAPTSVLMVPMPAACVGAPQPGDGNRLLFIGSNTAPNVLGLRWFLDAVWPLVRARNATAALEVAGTVAQAFAAEREGVAFLGLVDDLAACYARAGIVISPLRQGSGLKIKLVEALAHGKACVVTRATLQGVEQLAGGAVWQADTPAAFADAIDTLQGDPSARSALATSALLAARDHFSPERCFREFYDWLRLTGGEETAKLDTVHLNLKEKDGS